MFFLWEKNADVFFDRIKKRACVSHLKLKTRMCFWTEEKTRMCFFCGRKNADVFFDRIKKRVCVFIRIKKQNRVLYSHAVICDSCLVTSVGCGVTGSQYSCCALRCLFGLYCKWIPHLFRQVRLWKLAK